MVAMPCCGQCANLGFGDSSEDGVSRLTNRVTMANRKVADNPRISTPINAIGFSPESTEYARPGFCCGRLAERENL